MNKHFPMNLQLIDPQLYDTSALEAFPLQEASMELSRENAMFLSGLIKRYQPKTLLEVGVAAGGSSAFLLHTLDRLELPGELVSVDLWHRWFRDTDFSVGWAARKLYPEKKNWHLYTGKFLPEIIEDLNMEFDFCFLDTVHELPGELLDYLVALPFMRENGIIAMHDTALFFYDGHPHALATRTLFSACVGEKIIPPQNSVSDANLSAFRITPDTYQHVGNIFSALCMPWGYLFDIRQFQIYREFFLRYYGPEAAELFSKAMEWNSAQVKKQYRQAIKWKREKR